MLLLLVLLSLLLSLKLLLASSDFNWVVLVPSCFVLSCSRSVLFCTELFLFRLVLYWAVLVPSCFVLSCSRSVLFCTELFSFRLVWCSLHACCFLLGEGHCDLDNGFNIVHKSHIKEEERRLKAMNSPNWWQAWCQGQCQGQYQKCPR